MAVSGTPEVTFKVTGMVNGLLPAPADVTVILVFNVPTARPVVTIETPRACGVVPLPALRLSQLAPGTAVKLNPGMLLAIFSVCVAGAVPPN